MVLLVLQDDAAASAGSDDDAAEDGTSSSGPDNSFASSSGEGGTCWHWESSATWSWHAPHLNRPDVLVLPCKQHVEG